jgi:uncharacterized membrane protein YqjE
VARESTGIVGDVKALASTGLRAVRTRLELLAIELTEEKAWAVRFLIVALGALYLVGFGLMLAIFALVVWASAENRPAILAAFAGFFILMGAGGLAYIFTASRHRNPIFTDTIAVLKGDEQALAPGLRATGD